MAAEPVSAALFGRVARLVAGVRGKRELLGEAAELARRQNGGRALRRDRPAGPRRYRNGGDEPWRRRPRPRAARGDVEGTGLGVCHVRRRRRIRTKELPRPRGGALAVRERVDGDGYLGVGVLSDVCAVVLSCLLLLRGHRRPFRHQMPRASARGRMPPHGVAGSCRNCQAPYTKSKVTWRDGAPCFRGHGASVAASRGKSSCFPGVTSDRGTATVPRKSSPVTVSSSQHSKPQELRRGQRLRELGVPLRRDGVLDGLGLPPVAGPARDRARNRRVSRPPARRSLAGVILSDARIGMSFSTAFVSGRRPLAQAFLSARLLGLLVELELARAANPFFLLTACAANTWSRCGVWPLKIETGTCPRSGLRKLEIAIEICARPRAEIATKLCLRRL